MDTQQAAPAPESPSAGVATPAGGILPRIEDNGARRHVYRPERRVAGRAASCSVCRRDPMDLYFSDLHKRCECDNCAPLVHPQKRFASGACRSAYHDQLHPRINPPGVERIEGEGSIRDRIRCLLSGDGRNRTGDAIAFELRISGATALRELRKLRHDGAAVHMERIHGPSKPAVYWMSREQV